jgi:hypothetical protein
MQKYTREKILCTDAQNSLSLAVKLKAIRHKTEHQLYVCKALDSAGVTELSVLKNKDKARNVEDSNSLSALKKTSYPCNCIC